uniref:Co-chaperonin GroES n=1 Tax=uncultured virus TaxID=340016 RepID=A0A221S3V3_9VIRU|nr:co-chaperonin GroES [uncultured virus]
MIKITPLEDIVIVKIIEPEENKIGSIIINNKDVEPSTLAEVLIPNSFSYARNGELKQVTLRAGDLVRIPTGNIGTGVPEAPVGEKWLAIPEDCIYYTVKHI